VNRRSFLRSIGGCACATLLPSTLFLGTNNAAAIEAADKLDLAGKLHLADVALGTARTGGASYADFRLCRYQTEYIEVKERRLEESSTGISAGFSVRVLLDGTEDKLHQDYRAPAMPATHDLVRRLRAAGIPAVVSGAGPSVLVFLQAAVPGSRVMDSAVLDSTVRETGIGWLISSLDVERRGASVAPVVPSAR